MSTVILFDSIQRRWLSFKNPAEIYRVGEVDQVLPALHDVSALVEGKGWYAAGFLSFEAAPAFDPALRTRPPTRLPLLWFGIYEKPEVIQLPEAVYPPPYKFSDWKPDLDRAAYADAIAAIKNAIACGETYQVNFTLRLQASFSGNPWDLFLQLNQNQQSSYSAYIETEDFTICSASPELFFRLDGETITTRPMKGTARRAKTTVEDRQQQAWLQASEKNRAENVMIVDMLRNDLGRIAATGTINVPALFEVERYPTVWQMTSTVAARTSASIPQIFSALFPCASITGAPKVRTMQIIQHLEQQARQIYTGSIGFIAPGRRAQFNVAIRSILVNRHTGQAEYGVGGGIIWDSETEDEYQECLVKTQILSHPRPAFSLLETILWEPGTGFFLVEQHLQRLALSSEYFAYPIDLDYIKEKLGEVSAGFSHESRRVRLVLDSQGHLEVQATLLAASTSPEIPLLKLAGMPVNTNDVFLYHKTTNRITYQNILASCVGCDDVILWNERGEITETSIANLVFELDGEQVTPPISCGLLAGVYRGWLLEQQMIREKVVSVDDLQQCTKIYVVNSVRKQRLAQLV